MRECERPGGSGTSASPATDSGAPASSERRRVEFAQVWVCYSTFCSVAGWVLSWVNQLNYAGYLVLSALAAVGAVLAVKRSLNSRLALTQIRWSRFRRLFPGLFLLLATLSLVGGLLYGPSNYDALSYRIPRVLHWLAEGHWHWIHAEDPRLNTRSCGFEWLMAPMLLFLRTDRLLFLINFVSYLLLPGLVFQAFVALGVRRRVARHWMWIAPSGYCFLLQAASVSNDSFAAVYALAAVAFALRSRVTRSIFDLGLALVAGGLLTGAKGSNLPLLLPLALALLPSLKTLVARPLTSAIALGVAAVASFLPTAMLNIRYCADWSGAALEPKTFMVSNPWVGVVGNAAQFMLENFAPPFFPWARYWDDHPEQFLPGWLVDIFTNHFEAGGWNLGELPIEETAALGLGVTLLVLVSFIVAGTLARRAKLLASELGLCDWLLLLAPWVSLLAFSMKSGLNSAGRLVAPFYCLLLPVLLRGAAQALLVRRRWWKSCAVLVFFVAAVAVVITPARPLWPAVTATRLLHDRRPDSALAARAQRVYSVYAGRGDALAPILTLIPPTETVIGLVSWGDDPVASLWKPFGHRRLVYFLPQDSIEQLRQEQVRYVVVSPAGVKELFGLSAGQWAANFGAEIVGSVTLNRKASGSPEVWTVVKLRAP